MQGAWKSIATRPAPAEFFGCNAITPGGCRKRPQGCPKIVVRSITKLNLANDYPTYIGRKYANKLLVRPKPHENAEIASLAVSRFERDLKDCTELQRCRGWRRREWLVSELAQDALRRIEHQCRKRSLTAIAIGDIATARTAVTFAERPFALRSLDLVVSGASMDDRIALLQAARTGPAADAFESKSLKLWISSRKLWDAAVDPRNYQFDRRFR